jgi:excisionase family DNA binding protein
MNDRTALYVRIPTAAAARLDRAAFELKTSKQDLVTGLVSHYGDVDSLRRITVEASDDTLTIGHAEVRNDPPADVLDVTALAVLLQAGEDDVRALAESGELPGRKVGGDWRFSRAAVLRWLARD